MTSAVIYLDESGDLGWKFDAPFRQGGSSRYLTIAALVSPSDKAQHPKRLIRSLHERRKWKPGVEKKWSDMSPPAKLDFAEEAVKLHHAHKDLKYLLITVRKENVWQNIRRDPNKLYNYMIKIMLLDEMTAYERVTLVPDPRSIKVASGNSLHDYLQTELWLEKRAATVLSTNPQDSTKCLGLQFADMLSGAVREHHEDGNSGPFNVLRPAIRSRHFLF